MSGDEGFATIVCCVIALAGWARWYALSLKAARLGAAAGGRTPLLVTPAACIGLLFIILKLGASHDVRDSVTYMFMYIVMGAAWIVAWVGTLGFAGFSPRDDAIERNNTAAVVLVAGAMFGLTLAFAGGNIGDGPGWWVVIFSAGLASLALVQSLGGALELVSLERDIASGVRVAGFLVAIGMICGRGAAGNWTGFEPAVRDFIAIAWPVLIFAVVEIIASRAFRPTPELPERSIVTFGFIPAAIYISAAAACVWKAGQW